MDEAEIKSGQSILGMINHGLETSRFIALVLTPAYFASDSGWTDAEWHAALHRDPDNRTGRLVPLLVENWEYIPILIRHLDMIDMRGNRYKQKTGQGFFFPDMDPTLGVQSKEYKPRRATVEEMETLIGDSGGYEKLMPEQSVIGCIKFEISEDVTPVRADVVGLRPYLIKF